jgi:hypothetical protein
MAYDATTVPTRLGYEPDDIIARIRKLTNRTNDPTLSAVARAICNSYIDPKPTQIADIMTKALAKVKQHETISAQSRIRSIQQRVDLHDDRNLALDIIARTICGTFDTPSGKEFADTVCMLLAEN